MFRIFAFTLVAILFLACSGNDTQPNVAQQEQEELIPVTVADVRQMSATLPLSVSGILTSAGEQRLSFKVGGVIKRILVEEGDLVKPGQLLAELDKTEIDAQVRQAQEALKKAERDLARVEGLYRDSSATLELLQNATTGRDVAKETVRIATFNQQFAEIRASRPGKIIKKLANEGEVTGPGMPALVLFETGPNDWVVLVSVSDRDWARLSMGMPAKVVLDAYEGEVFDARVSDLAVAADPGNGLYPVELRLATKGKRLAPGLFARVEIAPAKAGVYTTVPIEALVEGAGKEAFVFALQPDGTGVKKLPVTVAFLENNQAMITAGLEGINAVVTAGAPYLTEKKRVKVVQKLN